VVASKTNGEIALDLGISVKTVEKHMVTIFEKLGVSSRVEAAVYSIREGLLKREGMP
jgi:DNA-binding NarL/FixJ family response regulator